MSALTRALRTTFDSVRGDVHIYKGTVDKSWTVIAQAQTTHPDVVQVTGHFLRASWAAPFEVHIRTLRVGKFNSNIAAEFIQKGEVKISAQLIFTSISAGTEDPRLTLAPASPFARRVPLHLHPAVAPLTPLFANANFHKNVRWAEDKAIRERNFALGRGERPAVGGGTLEWGAWLELVDPSETVCPAILPFLGDMMRNLPELLPKDQRPVNVWHPTMVFSLQYNAKIPDDFSFSKRTVGLYSRSSFMDGGRHDVTVEIWTAPSNIGEGKEIEGWREKQVCIGLAYQMASVVPSSVNERKAAELNSKL
ncbi:thioesterase-like superfamily-domain-containing protein [Hysterangium stoloniferum]|nr:thioesterase-like superfamily-domain-containing protein [Hysterangium stoloniferum]